MRLPILIITLILLSTTVQAAIIQGNIYDLDLKKINNVLISINTVPKQVFIANNGSYKIDVPQGGYILEAKEAVNDLYLQTPIEVKSSGDFILDLILIPSLEEINYLDEYENIVDLEINAPAKTNWTLIITLISAVIAVFALIIIYSKFKKTAGNTQKEPEKETKQEKNDIEKTLKIIKSEGGRITQKDLREKLGDMSEAKVSLLVAELESNNQVKKIKKGRGNIIILN